MRHLSLVFRFHSLTFPHHGNKSDIISILYLIILLWNSRGASFKEDDGTWKGNDDGKVVNNQPQRVMDERNGIGPQAGYIGRLVLLFDLLIFASSKYFV